MILTTERLRLRPFEEDDFDAVHSYASVYNNVRYMIWGPNSEEDTRNFIKNVMEQSKAVPQQKYDFAVTIKDGGKLIGGCGIYLKSPSEAEMGWILHRNYWKQGYGTEFARELLRFGFEDLKLHRIYTTCYAKNYGSYRVMERNGMRAKVLSSKTAREGRVMRKNGMTNSITRSWKRNGNKDADKKPKGLYRRAETRDAVPCFNVYCWR